MGSRATRTVRYAEQRAEQITRKLGKSESSPTYELLLRRTRQMGLRQIPRGLRHAHVPTLRRRTAIPGRGRDVLQMLVLLEHLNGKRRNCFAAFSNSPNPFPRIRQIRNPGDNNAADKPPLKPAKRDEARRGSVDQEAEWKNLKQR